MSATLPPASVRPAAAASDPIEFKRVKAIFVGSIGNLVEWSASLQVEGTVTRGTF